MAGTEYFGETAVQPRDHIPVNTIRKSHNHTFAALIRLSTTTHNLLTFNISEISSNNSENSTYWQVSTSGLFSYTRLIQVPGCRITRSTGTTLALFSHQKKTPGPGTKFTYNFALT